LIGVVKHPAMINVSEISDRAGRYHAV
jgi:hypothetical protein